MLRLLRRRELPWHRRVQARFRNVDGIVVIGDVHGDVRQLAGRARPLRLDWKPLRGTDPLAWLHWKSRLAPTLVGREREMASLRRWANESRGVRARVLSGEGGTGKTRLAAELAQELRDQGWQAGFADLRRSGDGATVFSTGAHGTLILLDYPEEHREATRELLRDLAALEGDEELRVLLLSRRGDDLWQPEIDRADAFGIFDEIPLELGPLPVQDLYRIFQEARDRVPVPEGTRPPAQVDEEAFATWLEGETSHRRPLFVLAAAIESALEPNRSVVRLQGREVIQALARRELTRLRDESHDAGLHPEALPRLTALAAVAGGLDTATLRRLAESEDTLELGLPPPVEVLDRLQPTGRLIQRDGYRLLPAPSPDLVAAAILVDVLAREPELAPERLWAAVTGDVLGGLERVGRLAYDAEVSLGLVEDRPSDWLARALEGERDRCSEVEESFRRVDLSLGLLPAASKVWRSLLGGNLDEGRRAHILNNLSVDLVRMGCVEEALDTMEETMTILRRLASSRPLQYGPSLAASLTNLSSLLLGSGRRTAALRAGEQAVKIYRRLAISDSSRFRPFLALSLNNVSNCLAAEGRREAALRAIEEAVELRRVLVSSNSSQYEPDLAQSLSNMSVHLRDAGHRVDALATIEEAVAMLRRLISRNPARYESELASSLTNLSVCLVESGEKKAALRAVEEASELHGRLASSNPQRYEPDLARSLNNLSNLQAEAGRGQEALKTIEGTVEIRRRLASSNPLAHEPDLAQSLSNLSLRLEESGCGEAALEAISEAAELIESYAQRAPKGPFGRLRKVIRRQLKLLQRKESRLQEGL